MSTLDASSLLTAELWKYTEYLTYIINDSKTRSQLCPFSHFHFDLEGLVSSGARLPPTSVESTIYDYKYNDNHPVLLCNTTVAIVLRFE